MKKTVAIVFLFIGLVSTGSLLSQELSKIRMDLPKTDNVSDYDCPDNALFSQPPLDYTWALVNSFNHPQVIYDNFYGVTKPIHGVRFWQQTGGGVTFPLEFTIEIYSDNAGNLGALQYSWVIVLSPLFNISSRYHVMNVAFPTPVNMTSGWIGLNISDNQLGYDDARVGWFSTSIGDDHIIWSPDFINYYHDTDGVAFCLKGESTSIPLTNWAIGIGIFLIVAVSVIRMRRFY